mmetsp:Transcript_110803/g.220385  ORF Transcript_110803/g.220385 Transcript_110803/m.220385 type:complete len:255 (+) Transcript_110803:113-877(+)
MDVKPMPILAASDNEKQQKKTTPPWIENSKKSTLLLSTTALELLDLMHCGRAVRVCRVVCLDQRMLLYRSVMVLDRRKGRRHILSRDVWYLAFHEIIHQHIQRQIGNRQVSPSEERTLDAILYVAEIQTHGRLLCFLSLRWRRILGEVFPKLGQHVGCNYARGSWCLGQRFINGGHHLVREQSRICVRGIETSLFTRPAHHGFGRVDFYRRATRDAQQWQILESEGGFQFRPLFECHPPIFPAIFAKNREHQDA